MGEWNDTIDPVAKKYELASMFGMSVNSDAKSCTAKAALLRKMAAIIDAEIEWRAVGVRQWRLFGWRIRLMRDER